MTQIIEWSPNSGLRLSSTHPFGARPFLKDLLLQFRNKRTESASTGALANVSKPGDAAMPDVVFSPTLGATSGKGLFFVHQRPEQTAMCGGHIKGSRAREEELNSN